MKWFVLLLAMAGTAMGPIAMIDHNEQVDRRLNQDERGMDQVRAAIIDGLKNEVTFHRAVNDAVNRLDATDLQLYREILSIRQDMVIQERINLKLLKAIEEINKTLKPEKQNDRASYAPI